MLKNKIQNIISELLDSAGISFEEVFFDDTEDAFCFISIKTDKPNDLIGRNGEVLSAINYLVLKILEKDINTNEIINFILDVNGFRKKKIENIKTTAHMLAERAKYFKSNIDVDPMPAYERKIMHSYLQNIKNVKTESTGFGKGRHIVIKYIEE